VVFIADMLDVLKFGRDIRPIAKFFLFAFLALVVIPLSIRSKDY